MILNKGRNAQTNSLVYQQVWSPYDIFSFSIMQVCSKGAREPENERVEKLFICQSNW